MKRLIWFLLLLPVCIPGYGQMEVGGITLESKETVKVSQKSGAWSNTTTGEKFPTEWITLNSGRFVYGIRHDQKYSSGAIGIMAPTTANWYQSGMLNILINGERFNLLPENHETIKLEEGVIGKAVFSWENEVTKLYLNFYLYALDDKLFMDILLEPKKEIKSIELRFTNYTAGFIYDRKHLIYTGERQIDKKGWNKINLPAERWLLLTDDNMDFANNNKSQGPSAIAYIPDNFTEAQIYLGGYSCGLNFKCKPEARRFIFALWEFPGKGNKETAGNIKELISDAVEKMNNLQKK
jgi:hypothetical protein